MIDAPVPASSLHAKLYEDMATSPVDDVTIIDRPQLDHLNRSFWALRNLYAAMAQNNETPEEVLALAEAEDAINQAARTTIGTGTVGNIKLGSNCDANRTTSGGSENG